MVSTDDSSKLEQLAGNSSVPQVSSRMRRDLAAIRPQKLEYTSAGLVIARDDKSQPDIRMRAGEQVMGATGGEVFGGNKSAVVNFLGFSKVCNGCNTSFVLPSIGFGTHRFGLHFACLHSAACLASHLYTLRASPASCICSFRPGSPSSRYLAVRHIYLLSLAACDPPPPIFFLGRDNIPAQAETLAMLPSPHPPLRPLRAGRRAPYRRSPPSWACRCPFACSSSSSAPAQPASQAAEPLPLRPRFGPLPLDQGVPKAACDEMGS